MLARVVDALNLFFLKFLTFGTEAAARQAAAHMTVLVLKADQEAAEAAAECMKTADELGAESPEIAELLKKATAHNFAQLEKVTNGVFTLGQGEEALAANPFSPNSADIGPPASAEPKPIEVRPGPNGTPPPPPKRKRGRPRKDEAKFSSPQA